jgi:MFS family permease
MAQRQEIAAVYSAAVIQGIVLVAFPAVSAIFTSTDHYGLSSTEYGGMFVPQAIMAILSSLLGAGLTHRIGGKRVFLIGLTADLFSTALLFISQFFVTDHSLAFGLLLAATACLGVGFGFVVPALNTFTAGFFPEKIDTAILTLNALLGLGTALAPMFAILFVGFGIWWGLPILMSALTLLLLLFSLRLPLKDAPSKDTQAKDAPAASIKMPVRFWLYAAFALTYGVCETLNGNWAPVYMAANLGASTTLASLALTVFWATVTAGRILFAFIEKWCPPRVTFPALPILLAMAFLATAFAPAAHPILAIFFFGLAGLACSALLPLVISLAQGELTTMTAAVAGGMIGFYQIGYGMAAFGVGPLQTFAKMSLGSIYGFSAVAALILTGLACIIVARSPSQAGSL